MIETEKCGINSSKPKIDTRFLENIIKNKGRREENIFNSHW